MARRDRPAVSRLGLGTAQFGFDYGIVNPRGRVPEAEAHGILKLAAASGCTLIDTASHYGEAEAVLGRGPDGLANFRVVTKTPAIKGAEVRDSDIKAFRDGLRQSLARLRVTSVDCLLVHHGRDLAKPGGDRLVGALQELRDEGLTRRIGVSVYDGAEIDLVLERFVPDVVQVPFNLMDRRLVDSGHLRALKARGIEIHARSIFLQGILLKDRAELPAFFARRGDVFRTFDERIGAAGLSPLQACLLFVAEHPAIDYFLAGAAGLDEFKQILRALEQCKDAKMDFSGLAIDDAKLVDPANWPG